MRLLFCCIWGGELRLLGWGRRPRVTLVLRPSSSPLLALYTQGLPSYHPQPLRTVPVVLRCAALLSLLFSAPGRPPVPHIHRPCRQLQVCLRALALMPPPRDPSSAPCPAVWALMSSGSLDCCGSVMLSPQLAGDPSRALPTSGSPPSPTQCPARSTCRAGARCSFSKRRRGLLSGLGSKGHGWQGS